MANCSTSPTIELPTGCAPTNSMKGTPRSMAREVDGLVYAHRCRRRRPNHATASDVVRSLGSCRAGRFWATAFPVATVLFLAGAFFALLAALAPLLPRASRDPFPPLASCTARRLIGPRTGDRSRNTQPTPGTGLPPTSRPSSNSQVDLPWNSWKESFERTVASALSATSSTKASPRPIVPAGAVRSSPCVTASSKASCSDSWMRCPNVASTMTVACSEGCSREEGSNGFVELRETGSRAAFRRDVGAIDDDVVLQHGDRFE